MRNVIIVAAALACVVTTATRFISFAEATNEQQLGWVDYDDLDQEERLKERPGNYQVLATVADFFDGIHQIRPAYRRCAFPVQLGRHVFSRADDIEKHLDREAKQGRNQNKLRKYNIQIRSLSINEAETFGKSAEFKKLFESDQKIFVEVRERHPGRAVVALVSADLESLRSPKVERGDEPFIFYLVWQRGRWLVAWFNKS